MDLTRKRKTLFWVLFFNLIIVVAEIAAGVIGHSLALISDAFHNITDMLSLGIAYIAVVFAARVPTEKMTYGYLRSEMMAGFVSSIFLVVIMLYVVFEAVDRLLEPVAVDPASMMIVGFIAFVANALSAFFLGHAHHEHHDHHHHEDMNIKAAWLHMISDAAISLGVVFGGAAIYFWQTGWVDPLLSILVSLYIGYEAMKIIKRTFFSLMDENPMDVEKITCLLLEQEDVCGVHDLHIWRPASSAVYMSVHLVFEHDHTLSEIDKRVESIRQALQKEGIVHVVIQPECHACSMETSVICTPSHGHVH
jgi:cobalt-zinc-cadmium efflux system protein